MTRQTDGKSLYEQQEERILAQSDAFISLLTKRGILGDHKIDNDKIRKAQQEKNRKSYHNTQLLLQHYRNIAWLLECLPMDIAKELEEPYEDPDEATAEILYMFFNRRSCIDEPFSSRVERVVVDTMASKNKIIGIDEVPHIRFAHFIAPRGIDLKHHNYVIMDGLYYTFLYIKGDGYPSRVRAGWMSALINAGEGVDIDVHLRRENRTGGNRLYR